MLVNANEVSVDYHSKAISIGIDKHSAYVKPDGIPGAMPFQRLSSPICDIGLCLRLTPYEEGSDLYGPVECAAWRGDSMLLFPFDCKTDNSRIFRLNDAIGLHTA